MVCRDWSATIVLAHKLATVLKVSLINHITVANVNILWLDHRKLTRSCSGMIARSLRQVSSLVVSNAILVILVHKKRILGERIVLKCIQSATIVKVNRFVEPWILEN